jgi:serine/threonine protein kinase
MRKYKLIAKKGEGTFSEVIKAQNIKNSTFVAIKCMRNVSSHGSCYRGRFSPKMAPSPIDATAQNKHAPFHAEIQKY